MPLELINSIRESSRTHRNVDEDLIIFTVKVENYANSTSQVLAFRSSSQLKLQEVIDSIDHALDSPGFWMAEKNKWQDTDLTLEQAGITTGSQLELRNYSYSLDLSIIEIRGQVNYKTHSVTIRVSPTTTINEILIKMEMKENVRFATSGELIWKQVLLPEETKVASLFKNKEVLHFHPEKVSLEIQVPILNDAKAFKSKIDAFSGQTIEEIKSGIVKSLIPKASKSLPFQLIFKGARLAGPSYLGDLGNSDGSLLHLAKVSDAAILVHLQNDSGAYFDLRLKPSMKIEDLKKMIHSKRDYPVEHQVLKFSETILKDDACLHEYDVVSGANLDIFLQEYTIKIYDSVQKKDIFIKVKASDTIKKVKGRINIINGVQSEDQMLVLGEETLQDLSILCEIGLVEEGGKLDLSYDPDVVDKADSKITFMIKSYTGRTMHFKALPNTRIGKIKAILDRAEGVQADQQILIFEGKRMEDSSTLQDHDVQTDDCLDLIVQAKGCSCGWRVNQPPKGGF